MSQTIDHSGCFSSFSHPIRTCSTGKVFTVIQVASGGVLVCSGVALTILLFTVPDAGLWLLAPAAVAGVDTLFFIAITTLRLLRKKRPSVLVIEEVPPPEDTSILSSQPLARARTPDHFSSLRPLISSPSAPRVVRLVFDIASLFDRFVSPPFIPPQTQDHSLQPFQRPLILDAEHSSDEESDEPSPPLQRTFHPLPITWAPPPMRTTPPLPHAHPKIERKLRVKPTVSMDMRKKHRTKRKPRNTKSAPPLRQTAEKAKAQWVEHPPLPFDIAESVVAENPTPLISEQPIDYRLLTSDVTYVPKDDEQQQPLREKDDDALPDAETIEFATNFQPRPARLILPEESEESDPEITDQKAVPLEERIKALVIDSRQLRKAIKQEQTQNTLRANVLRKGAHNRARSWKGKLKKLSQREISLVDDDQLEKIAMPIKWTPEKLIDDLADPLVSKFISVLQQLYLAHQRISQPKKSARAVDKGAAQPLKNIELHLQGIWKLFKNDLLRTASLQDQLKRIGKQSYIDYLAPWFNHVSTHVKVSTPFKKFFFSLSRTNDQAKALSALQQALSMCFNIKMKGDSLLVPLLEVIIGSLQPAILKQIQTALTPRYQYFQSLHNVPINELDPNEHAFLKFFTSKRLTLPIDQLSQYERKCIAPFCTPDAILDVLIGLNIIWSNYGAPLVPKKSPIRIDVMIDKCFLKHNKLPATLKELKDGTKFLGTLTPSMKNYYQYVRLMVEELLDAFQKMDLSNLSQRGRSLFIIVAKKIIDKNKKALLKKLGSSDSLHEVRKHLTYEAFSENQTLKKHVKSFGKKSSFQDQVIIVLKHLMSQQIDTLIHDPLLFEIRKIGKGFENVISLKELGFDVLAFKIMAQPWAKMILTFLDPKATKSAAFKDLYHAWRQIEKEHTAHQNQLKSVALEPVQKVIDALSLSPDTTSHKLREKLVFAITTLKEIHIDFPKPLLSKATSILNTKEIDPFALRRNLLDLFLKVSSHYLDKAHTQFIAEDLRAKASENMRTNLRLLVDEEGLEDLDRTQTQAIKEHFPKEISDLKARGLLDFGFGTNDELFEIEKQIQTIEDELNFSEFQKFNLSLSYSQNEGLGIHPVHNRHISIHPISQEQLDLLQQTNHEINQKGYTELRQIILKSACERNAIKEGKVLVIPFELNNLFGGWANVLHHDLSEKLSSALKIKRNMISFKVVRVDQYQSFINANKLLEAKKEVSELEQQLTFAHKKSMRLLAVVGDRLLSPAMLVKSYQGGKLASVLGTAISGLGWFGSTAQKKIIAILLNYFFNSSDKEALGSVSFLPPKEMQMLKDHLYGLLPLFIGPLSELLLSDKPTPAKKLAHTLADGVIQDLCLETLPGFLSTRDECTREEILNELLVSLNQIETSLQKI